ncbi:MAG TPA: YbdK family carboxylate-amine ligase [Solirubrobacteraceae bacterium]|jgi:carboxylate-amine ligase|nr:YbdK family carboxylate-amine ligase [Solirubrobacteraceae bacterium]
MDHRFVGPRYTVGIEEELMILDPATHDLVNAVDTILADAAPPHGTVQPELLESVLEIATDPCPSVPAVAAELRTLRGHVRDRAREHGLEIGAAGTHPFARWEDQRVVGDDRYRGLIRSLGFVARQELVFGMHVHVGMADPEEAISVANALREYVPLLIALSANSPLWRGGLTGLMSSRVPIFRAFPRVGLPPRFAGWEDYCRRVQAMVDAGMIEDYTYLWYDVRPHPRLGTIEIRAMDSQTRVSHTIALAALIVSLVRSLVQRTAAGEEPPELAWELLDENRWLSARHGLDAELLDPATSAPRSARELTAELLEQLLPHARELGCEEELRGIEDLLSAGNGASRQRMVFEANEDLRELVAEIVALT